MRARLINLDIRRFPPPRYGTPARGQEMLPPPTDYTIEPASKRKRIQHPCDDDYTRAKRTRVHLLPHFNEKVQQLKRFARHGGPDLSNLRGYRPNPSMSQSSTCSRKRSSRSLRSQSTLQSAKIRPSDATYTMTLIDNGIYPPEWPTQTKTQPQDLLDIQQHLQRPRASLNVHNFSHDAFNEFKRCVFDPSNEATTMQYLNMLTGSDSTGFATRFDVEFNNLEPIAIELSNAKPDMYDGERPESMHKVVRQALQNYIVPSNQSHYPMLSNFFLEGKSCNGKSYVSTLQASHDGALGARGIKKLLQWCGTSSDHEENALAFACTFCDGQLRLFATHCTKDARSDREHNYHTTLLGAYALTHSRDRCVEGVTAFRNLRDLAESRRRAVVAEANKALISPSGDAMQVAALATSSVTLVNDLQSPLEHEHDGGSETTKRPRKEAS